MAARRFGALDLQTTNETLLMSGTSGWDSTVNVRFTNRNSTPVRVRLALVDAPAAGALAALSDEDYLEYDIEIRPNGVLENSGLVVPEDHSLVVKTDIVNVSVIAYGFEEQKV